MKEKVSITLDKGIIRSVDSFIDRVFVRNRSQAIESLLKQTLDKNKTAVILLGGKEEKLKIDELYLPEINIRGTPLIEKTIRNLREKNFKEIFIIARKKILEAVFGIVKDGSAYGTHIHYVEEFNSEGSAESLKLLKGRIKDTFLVVFGDLIFDKIKINDLWQAHLKDPNMATITLSTYKNPIVKGESFLEGNKVIEFNQKPKAKKTEDSFLVFSPILVCEPAILQYPGASLEEDIFPVLAKKRLLNGYMSSYIEVHIHTKRDIEKANKGI